ncbi:MAG: hypothetical protein LAQ69_32145 [Acidobacteriia bacterium]|nr:hypothetical protein [Terriglobia bacterium]
MKNNGLAERGDPEYYEVRKHSSGNVGPGAAAVIRSGMDPGAMARSVRAEVAGLDPALPVNIGSMQEVVGKLAARPRFNALLLSFFACIGVLLAAIGLYGVISFLVAQRTQEIGVRVALGATPGAIIRMVLGNAGRWTAAGALLGVVGSLFTARLLRAMLFQISDNNAWARVGALAGLLGIALLAAWVPARRAARVDPIQALRQD